ncbi:MAG TPA: NTP transferase domain-containing protein [Dongiaceae bacterium]|jgi:NDP-sugar pyrophosphorylase family protein
MTGPVITAQPGNIGAITAGAIIAAGEGSRLRAGGWSGSKPLLPIAGRPLIAHSLERFRDAGIARIAMIINEESPDSRQWLEREGKVFNLDLVIRSTPSSYASFRIVAERLAGQAAVITTVDSIMAAADFRRFLAEAAKAPEGSVVLGLTAHIDDEKPLWARLDRVSGRIRTLGEPNTGLVTAGVYVLPAQRPAEPAGGFARLRDYLAWLVVSGHPVHGVIMGRVFDIDRAEDAAAAEAALAGETRRSKGA